MFSERQPKHMEGGDSDSDYEESSPDSNPLHYILPGILAELTHLDLSGRVVFKESRVVSGGTYGDFFKARCAFDSRGKVRVTIKRLRFYLKEDIKLLFEKEIYVWSKLKHDNVLPLLGFAFDDISGYPLLISQWMDKGSAWSYVSANPKCDVIQLVVGTAEGLAYLHDKGVVHSDVKSDNILVSDSGEALICDFGCARMISASRSLANLSYGPKGTMRYLAYELVAREDEYIGYSAKANVWAFGTTVFELLTRQRPYQHLREAQVSSAIIRLELPSLPPSSANLEIFWEICRRCWNYSPEIRTDMASVLEDLRNFQKQKGAASQDPVRDLDREGELQASDLILHPVYHGFLIGGPVPMVVVNDIVPMDDVSETNFRLARPGLELATNSFTDDNDRRKLSVDSVRSTIRQSVYMNREGLKQQDHLDADSLHGELDRVSLAADPFPMVTDQSRVHNEEEIESDALELPVKGRKPMQVSDPHTLLVWHANSGVVVCSTFEGHMSGVSSVAYAPDGRHIVSGCDDGTIRIWDAKTGEAITEPLIRHSDSVSSVAFSSDGKHIVSGSSDKTIRILDAQTGAATSKPLKRHSDDVLSVAFSPDGRCIASGSDDTMLRLWDVQTGAAIGKPLKGHTGSISSVAFSRDGRRIASGSSDETIRFWDAETGMAIGMLVKGHKSGISSIAFSPDGRYIISGSDDWTIRFWDAQTGATIGEPLLGHVDSVLSVAFSPDGTRIVSGSEDKTIRLWDVETRTAISQPWKGHMFGVLCVAFSPDGTHIVSGSGIKVIKYWNASRRDVVFKSFERHKSSASFDASSSATVSNSKSIRLSHHPSLSSQRPRTASQASAKRQSSSTMQKMGKLFPRFLKGT